MLVLAKEADEGSEAQMSAYVHGFKEIARSEGSSIPQDVNYFYRKSKTVRDEEEDIDSVSDKRTKPKPEPLHEPVRN